jgi:hypothetical protein
MKRFLPLLILALLGPSCALFEPEEDPLIALLTEGSADVESGEAPETEDFGPIMSIVTEALQTGDDDMVESLLLRMRARGADGDLLDWIENVESILMGRKLVRELDLTLEIRELPLEGGGVVRMLGLRADSVDAGPVVFSISPPVLQVERSWIVPNGQSGQESDSVGIDSLTDLEFTGGEGEWIPITPLMIPRSQAAAVLETWSLEMHHCYFELGGERIPVNAPPVASCDRYLLAAHLQLGWLEADTVASLLVAVEQPTTPQLVERAVRTPPENWAQALDEITLILDSLPEARLAQVAPVLAWFAMPEVSASEWGLEDVLSSMDAASVFTNGQLLHPSALRHNPSYWREWLKARAGQRQQKPAINLDLPIR